MFSYQAWVCKRERLNAQKMTSTARLHHQAEKLNYARTA
jgi:hypothetical protein